MVVPISKDAAAPAAPAPLLNPLSAQESMVQYFTRFKAAVDLNSYCSQAEIDQPGLWLYKRPVLSPNGGANPLAVCGSVYHHCVLFIKDAASGEVHSLDYGPANGCDVTCSLMEALPARQCLARSVNVQHVLSASPSEQLPFMYLGPLAMELHEPEVQQAIQHAESQRYHALQNNCIHFADAMARLLTRGKVVSAPLLYDVLCGKLPDVDNPTVLMLQMMLQLSWISVCDGSRLYANMLAAIQSPTQQPCQQQQQESAGGADTQAHAGDCKMAAAAVLGKRGASTAFAGSGPEALHASHQDKQQHLDRASAAPAAPSALDSVLQAAADNKGSAGSTDGAISAQAVSAVGVGGGASNAPNPAGSLLQQLAQAAAGREAAGAQAAASMAMRLLAAYAAQVPSQMPASGTAAQAAGVAADSDDN